MPNGSSTNSAIIAIEMELQKIFNVKSSDTKKKSPLVSCTQSKQTGFFNVMIPKQAIAKSWRISF